MATPISLQFVPGMRLIAGGMPFLTMASTDICCAYACAVLISVMPLPGVPTCDCTTLRIVLDPVNSTAVGTRRSLLSTFARSRASIATRKGLDLIVLRIILRDLSFSVPRGLPGAATLTLSCDSAKGVKIQGEGGINAWSEEGLGSRREQVAGREIASRDGTKPGIGGKEEGWKRMRIRGVEEVRREGFQQFGP
eukprot:1752786-Rhodomonas_salina.1